MRHPKLTAPLIGLSAVLFLPTHPAPGDTLETDGELDPYAETDTNTGAAEPEKPDGDSANDAAMRHIELLEQILRELGQTPPARPAELDDTDPPAEDLPIVPAALDAGALGALVDAINRRGESAPAALRRVRASLTHDDNDRVVTADAILTAVERWAERRLADVEALDKTDPVAAYMQADDVGAVLGSDPIATPFTAYIAGLKADRAKWRHVESMAALCRVLEQADAIGLTGDWAHLDFKDNDIREAVKQIITKMKLIMRSWPRSAAAEKADALFTAWQEREAQILANLPAWRYTSNLGLIKIGTKETTTITTETDTDGNVTITEKDRILYDPQKVVMFGTFQNTSDKAYRYTFVVGASTRHVKQWPPEDKFMTGFALVQTPVLGPGEVYDWKTEFGVSDIRDVRQYGICKVENHKK